jgi:hypothetical protein
VGGGETSAHASAHTSKVAAHPMGGNIHNRIGDEM